MIANKYEEGELRKRNHALDDGETIADASVRTGDECHQVAIHTRKRMRRFWYTIPSLRPNGTSRTSMLGYDTIGLQQVRT